MSHTAHQKCHKLSALWTCIVQSSTQFKDEVQAFGFKVLVIHCSPKVKPLRISFWLCLNDFRLLKIQQTGPVSRRQVLFHWLSRVSLNYSGRVHDSHEKWGHKTTKTTTTTTSTSYIEPINQSIFRSNSSFTDLSMYGSYEFVMNFVICMYMYMYLYTYVY